MEEKMKKQIKVLIYIIMAISLVACTFVGVRRIQTENSYKDVEIAVRYSDILRISIEGEVPLEEVLVYLKEQGVTTILAKEMTVATVSDKDYNTFKGLGEVTLVDGYILKFSYPEVEEIKPDTRYIITENSNVVDIIDKAYRAKGIELAIYEAEGTYFLEIGDNGSAITGLGIGFDTENLNLAASLGFTISPQVKSWENTDPEVMPGAVQYLISELEGLDNLGAIYFADAKVPAVNNETFVEFMEDKQLGFIEFSSNKQEGFGLLAKKTSDFGTDYKVVRLHALEDNKLSSFTVSDLMERYELALKERSNRVFLFKMPGGSDLKEDVAYLTEAVRSFKKIAQEDGYTVTNVINDYNMPAIPTAVAILAGLASIMVFILLVAETGFVKTGYVLGILGIIGYVGLLKLNPNFASKAMALFGSIMFPTYAVIKGLREEPRDIKESILALLKICAISFGGTLAIIGCLSRTNFALTIDVFMGVKFATVLPIILVLAYLIYKEHGFDFKYYKGILDRKISYGALIAIALLGMILYVYISRTGNTGTATDLERGFRQLLDNVLGVRPRTKEFLIAYPILLALLHYGYKEKYLIAAIFAVIGPISLVNTYAHIHTPILISLIRSAYGIIFGIVIGLILIGVIKLINKVIKKWQTK